MASSNQDTFDPYSTENLSALEDKLGVIIKKKELLKKAISTRAARARALSPYFTEPDPVSYHLTVEEMAVNLVARAWSIQ